MENKKTLGNSLGDLIGTNLDLELFFAINIDTSKARLLGNYSEDKFNYLLNKEFVIENNLYDADNNTKIEMKHKTGKVKIILFND
jgi:hypothetical protein